MQNGYVVISTDIGQHEIYETGRTLMGERLWDLMRCVDYLESLPFVDTHRIACAGLSLGGEMAMWLGAMDTRIKATVVCGFLTYMDQMEKNHCLCWKFPGLREAVDFPDIYGLIAPRALQCQNGEKEPPDQFPPSLAQKAWLEIKVVYEKFVAVDKMELVIHPGGHEIAIEPMLNFLNKQLNKTTLHSSIFQVFPSYLYRNMQIQCLQYLRVVCIQLLWTFYAVGMQIQSPLTCDLQGVHTRCPHRDMTIDNI